MKTVVAIDSFKGSLTTFEAGEAAKKGIMTVYPDAEVEVCPIADGGEGTVEAIVSQKNGEYITVNVHGPLSDRVDAVYGYIKDSATAVIEMSAASGITLVAQQERNPLNTTTYGVGEVISDAIRRGCRKFVIGIGGSATNDGGIGMLSALGYRFLDSDGNDVPLGAKGLEKLCSIDVSGALKELKECTFTVACDVKNVLCGSEGCSAVVGPQKGATPHMIALMDRWLLNYAFLTKKVIPSADENLPGTGAAGGMGFALTAYLGAALTPGIDIVIEETSLEDKIKNADVVITGEGRLDGQSCMGKVPVGVAAIAKKHGKPVLAFCGSAASDAIECNKHGIDAFFPVVRTPCSLEEAMDSANAQKNLADTAEQVFRLIQCFKINEY